MSLRTTKLIVVHRLGRCHYRCRLCC